MKELQKKLVENLKGYSFEELETLLNKNEIPEVREAIMKEIEKYYEKEFYAWLG